MDEKHCDKLTWLHIFLALAQLLRRRMSVTQEATPTGPFYLCRRSRLPNVQTGSRGVPVHREENGDYAKGPTGAVMGPSTAYWSCLILFSPFLSLTAIWPHWPAFSSGMLQFFPASLRMHLSFFLDSSCYLFTSRIPPHPSESWEKWAEQLTLLRARLWFCSPPGFSFFLRYGPSTVPDASVNLPSPINLCDWPSHKLHFRRTLCILLTTVARHMVVAPKNIYQMNIFMVC